MFDPPRCVEAIMTGITFLSIVLSIGNASVDRLSSPDWSSREAASERIACMGPLALPALSRGIHAPDLQTRHESYWLAVRIVGRFRSAILYGAACAWITKTGDNQWLDEGEQARIDVWGGRLEPAIADVMAWLGFDLESIPTEGDPSPMAVARFVWHHRDWYRR